MVIAFAGGAASAEQRFFVEAQALGGRLPGQSIPVHYESDIELQAMSIAIDFDEDLLEITDVRTLGRFADSEFQDGVATPGRVVFGLVFDFEGDEHIPPTADTVFFELIATTADVAEVTTTEIVFRDEPLPKTAGPGEVNLMADLTGASVEVSTSNGILTLTPNPNPQETTRFVRGDGNADGAVNLADAVYTLRYLFVDGDSPACLDASDANDDGGLGITDGIFVLRFLFRGGDPIPAPGVCGTDPTADELVKCEDPRGVCE